MVWTHIPTSHNGYCNKTLFERYLHIHYEKKKIINMGTFDMYCQFQVVLDCSKITLQHWIVHTFIDST